MVMGRCHAVHGLTAGLLASNLAPLLEQPMDIPTALVLGGLGAGAAIAPDLDHPGATASRSIGVVSALGSAAIRTLSASVYAHTRTRHDRDNASGHRGLTHTVPGALGLGAVFGGIVAVGDAFGSTAGIATTCAVIWLFLVWALRALPPKHDALRDYVTASVLTALSWLALHHTYAGSIPLLLGLVIALGALVHSLGDALTDYGSPLLWPHTFRGERWYGAGMPKPLRFKAGKKVENRLVFPASVVLAAGAVVGIIPGAWPRIFYAASLLWA
jgi:membrane-bound metal-dependent hydrolase YbcI (DUF457 family)